jgi:hypothetical protein
LNFELTVALSSINAPKYPDPRSEKYVTSWERGMRRKSVTKTGRTQAREQGYSNRQPKNIFED